LRERDLSWSELKPVIGRLWKPVLLAFLIAGVAGYFLAFLLPLKWRAEAIIQIEEPPSSRSLGLFGSYESLIPSGLGGGYGARAFAFLRSNDLALRMTERDDIKAYLFKRKWDERKGEWKKAPPEDAERVEKFREVLNLDQNELSGLIHLSVDAPDAERALAWTRAMIAQADRVAQEEEASRLVKSAGLIRELAENQAVEEYRSALFDALTRKMVDAYLMESEPVFSYRLISSAVLPDKAAWPKKRWVALACAVAAGVSVSLVRLRRSR